MADDYASEWVTTPGYRVTLEEKAKMTTLPGSIRKAANGYILDAGCQGTFVFTTRKQLLKKIEKLLDLMD